MKPQQVKATSYLASSMLTLSDSIKQVGLEVNTEKSNDKFMSRHQIAGQNRNLKIPNEFFENVAKVQIFLEQ
jgi:hypothetical protein